MPGFAPRDHAGAIFVPHTAANKDWSLCSWKRNRLCFRRRRGPPWGTKCPDSPPRESSPCFCKRRGHLREPAMVPSPIPCLGCLHRARQ